MSRKFFKKVDKFLTRWEMKGQNTANTMHRWAINLLLLGIGYNLFTIVRGYNRTMIDMRVGSHYQNSANEDDDAPDMLQQSEVRSRDSDNQKGARPGRNSRL
jgi:hypothetical protein